MENDGSASPAEQLAAEVAGDTSEAGEVTQDDVAELLNPKYGKASRTDSDSDGDGSDGEGDSDDDADGDSADVDDTGNGDDDTGGDDSGDGEELEEEEEQEVADADEREFTLKVTDANGKEFVLSPDDDIEKILEDFEPKSNGQIFKILQDLQKLETARTEHETEQQEQATQAEYKERLTNIRTGWDKEIEVLKGEKRIPVEADGKIPARVTEVFKYMSEINAKREAAGQPLVQSFEDALDKLELKESKDESVKKDKDERALARKRGAVVGGSSAPASSGVSNYKRGARTAIEAVKQMGILR